MAKSEAAVGDQVFIQVTQIVKETSKQEDQPKAVEGEDNGEIQKDRN